MSNVSAFPSPARDSHAQVPIPDIPKQTILDYLAAIGLSPELTEAERTQFVSVCQAFGLNPFKREVYATVYGEGSYRRFSVIVGYETYLKRADRSGKLDGWSSRIEGSGDDMKAIVEIHRRDWSEPLVHEVYFVEAVQKKKDGRLRRSGRRCRASSSRRSASPRPSACASRTSSVGSRIPLTSSPTSSPWPPLLLRPLRRRRFPCPNPRPPFPRPHSLTEASSARDEPPPQPEASAAPSSVPQSSAAPTIRFLGYQDPYPDEPQSALIDRLTVYLDDNAEAFTDRHSEWILEKAQASRDRHGVLKMLAYSEKVVRNASAVASA